jgi:hypothetical protein
MIKRSSRVRPASRRTLLPLSSAFARAAGEGAAFALEARISVFVEDLETRWRSSGLSDILKCVASNG